MRESKAKMRARLKAILERLEGHPALKDAAIWELKAQKKTPFQALVATLLSSRTRDETTARVARELFREIRKPEDVLKFSEAELARKLYPVGFYRTKARALRELARILLERHGGEVPASREELMALPGVGRKTANIVLAEAFGAPTIGVDVHVHRIAHRLGLVKGKKKPEEVETELVALTDPEDRPRVNRLLVALGQKICLPRNPRCEVCPVRDLCPEGRRISQTRVS